MLFVWVCRFHQREKNEESRVLRLTSLHKNHIISKIREIYNINHDQIEIVDPKEKEEYFLNASKIVFKRIPHTS